MHGSLLGWRSYMCLTHCIICSSSFLLVIVFALHLQALPSQSCACHGNCPVIVSGVLMDMFGVQLVHIMDNGRLAPNEETHKHLEAAFAYTSHTNLGPQ